MTEAALAQIALGLVLGALGLWGWKAAAGLQEDGQVLDPAVLRRGAVACIAVGALIAGAGVAALVA